MANTRKPRTGTTKQPTVQPRQSRQQRRTKAIAVAIVGLLSLGLLATTISATTGPDAGPDSNVPTIPTIPTSGPLAVTVPGDLDGDDKVTESEQTEIQQTVTTADNLTSALGPEAVKVASSIAVTPAGQNWWDFIAAQSSYARLWEMPFPEHANWYALTWTKRFGKDNGALSMYPAVHLSFTTAAEATVWAQKVGETPRGLALDFLFRDNVLTVAPAGTTLVDEPFPKRLSKIEDVPQTSGYWAIDYAQQIALTTPDSKFASTYRAYWQQLGLGKAKWSAVSRDPGRWVGRISGFDAKTVNVENALIAVNRTMDVDTGALNAAIIATQMYARQGDITFGDDWLVPDQAPEDADLVFSVAGGMASLMVSDLSFESTVIGGFAHWIVGDVMTVTTLAPQETRVSQENPQGLPTPTPGSTGFPSPGSIDENPPVNENGDLIEDLNPPSVFPSPTSTIPPKK